NRHRARHTPPSKLTSRSAPLLPPSPARIPEPPLYRGSPPIVEDRRGHPPRQRSGWGGGGGGPRAQVKGPPQRKRRPPRPLQQPRFREAHVAIASDDHMVVDRQVEQPSRVHELSRHGPVVRR